MSISATDVSELRKSTGAGMMDCKKAVGRIRRRHRRCPCRLPFGKKGAKKSAENGPTVNANEGVVVVLTEGQEGMLLALSCETDFVAKNENFIALDRSQSPNSAWRTARRRRTKSTALPIEGTTRERTPRTENRTHREKIEVSESAIVEGVQHLFVHSTPAAKRWFGSYQGPVARTKRRSSSVALRAHRCAETIEILHPMNSMPGIVEEGNEAYVLRIIAENELNEKENLGNRPRNVPCSSPVVVQLTPEVMAATRWKRSKRIESRKANGKRSGTRIVPGKLDRFISDNTALDQERCLLSQFLNALDEHQTCRSGGEGFARRAEIVEFKRVRSETRSESIRVFEQNHESPRLRRGFFVEIGLARHHPDT